MTTLSEINIEKKAHSAIMDYLTAGHPDGDIIRSTIGADDNKQWYIKGYKQCQEDNKFNEHDIKKTTEIETRKYSLLLRWILKHYSTITTNDGFFNYVDSMGRDVEIEDIIKHYKIDNQ